MGDPRQRYENRDSPVEGVGPYRTGDEFPEVPDLGVDEEYRLDLRRYDRGRYVALSPKGYDSLSVTNGSGERLVVTVNESTQFTVPPNSVVSQTYDGAYVVEVKNEGTSALGGADTVVVEVQKEPLGADEAARERAKKGPLAQVVEHFTGLGGGA